MKKGSCKLLVAVFFPRSIDLEGVGTFIFGLAQGMADLQFEVQLLIPSFSSENDKGLNIEYYSGRGINRILNYRQQLKRLSVNADNILLIENNPATGWLGHFPKTASRTLWYFYTPLQTLDLLKRLNWRSQGLIHGLTKHLYLARMQDWGKRRCVVATQFQANQLQTLQVKAVHVFPGSSVRSDETKTSGRVDAREELGWDEQLVVGYMGHFSPAKGVENLLCAMASTNKHILAIAYSGKGKLNRKGRAAFAQLQKQGRLREYGVISPSIFLRACDVTVLPYPAGSIHHLPLVLLESYAAGTPVITTCVGGIGEIHRDQLFGALIPPNDINALVSELESLSTNLQKWHQKGKAAQIYFDSNLSRSVFCRQLKNIMDKNSK